METSPFYFLSEKHEVARRILDAFFQVVKKHADEVTCSVDESAYGYDQVEVFVTTKDGGRWEGRVPVAGGVSLTPRDVSRYALSLGLRYLVSVGAIDAFVEPA